MNPKTQTPNDLHLKEQVNETQALPEKLLDALTPGLQVEFDPDEAMKAGAFIEDALTEADAKDSCFDEMDISNAGTKDINMIRKGQ
ncbi:TPA: protein TraD [Legionella pneumophila]|nr:protein TraD [Legionella pneumophila]HAU9905600.1 protein TraD [Legionella pneumophila]HAU9927046.1 protein TraD [Legionella pneumophila]HAU9930814.1 protein TraD [Legionella pneumophila]HAU9933649.1 protein TraD [Legionella pneumophila]